MIQEILQEKIIERDFYMKKIRKFFNTPLIKVLIWQRRVWKSTILKYIIKKFYETNEIPKNNFFYINKELPKFDYIKNYKDLDNEFKKFLENIDQNSKIFIWIDEIQEITGWEKFINGYLATYQEKAEIFITWSNSFLLSGELATYITWRYIEFHIYPLNFDEFCIFKKEKKSKNNFLEYLKFGWLPAIFKMEYSEEVIFSYLLWVYNTIILKDIIQYHQIRNIVFFKDLYKYTLSNIWNIVSTLSIKKYLRSQNIKIWNDTILNFLNYAQETFLLHKIYSVNPSTKKIFEIYNKYYIWDLWLRNALVWYNFNKDIWKLLENYVFLELKRNWYNIEIGRLKWWKEIDFIAEKQGKIVYLQVCYLLWWEDTIEREYGSLKNINDNWPKYVVSFDDIDMWINEWIEHINIMNIWEIL